MRSIAKNQNNRIGISVPKIAVNGTELFYQIFDEMPNDLARKETMVFSHGYLMNHTMFSGQINVFKKHFRCIAFEHRGHAQSAIATDGYSMDNLVTDAIALLECLDKQLNTGPVHFVGMSTGGFVGMRIALRRPELLRSLVLMSTSAEPEPQKALRKNTLLLRIVKYIGMWAVIGQVIKMMFYRHFLNDNNQNNTVSYWRNAVLSQNKNAMVAFGKAIFARDNVLPKLSQLNLPVAVIVGDKDPLTQPIYSERMAQSIPGASLFKIKDAGHFAAIEDAQAVTEAMTTFYKLKR